MRVKWSFFLKKKDILWNIPTASLSLPKLHIPNMDVDPQRTWPASRTRCNQLIDDLRSRVQSHQGSKSSHTRWILSHMLTFPVTALLSEFHPSWFTRDVFSRSVSSWNRSLVLKVMFTHHKLAVGSRSVIDPSHKGLKIIWGFEERSQRLRDLSDFTETQTWSESKYEAFQFITEALN